MRSGHSPSQRGFDIGSDLGGIDLQIDEHPGDRILGRDRKQRQEDMLCPDVTIAAADRRAQRAFEHCLRAVGERNVAARLGSAGAPCSSQRGVEQIRIEPDRGQRLRIHAIQLVPDHRGPDIERAEESAREGERGSR